MASTHDYEIDSRNDNIQIYIDGQFYPRTDAKVSVMDSGYLLGDGVWEGIRLYNNHLIHLEKHLERLYEGAETIQMDIGISKSEMKSAIEKTLKKNEMISDVHIRLIVSRGIKSTTLAYLQHRLSYWNGMMLWEENPIDSSAVSSSNYLPKILRILNLI